MPHTNPYRPPEVAEAQALLASRALGDRGAPYQPSEAAEAQRLLASRTFGRRDTAPGVPSQGVLPSVFVIGDLLYANTVSTLARLADAATGNVLRAGGVGVAPAWGQVALTTDVTGTLPAANGGTGQSSYTVGDLLYASGATALSKLADVAVGSFLRSGGIGSVPGWSTTTLPNSAIAGDLLYASAANTYSNLADVATGNALLSGGIGIAPAWGKVSLTAAISGILPTANGGTGVSSLASLTANPSASIGLTAVNGSASTFMRSDAAPALDQSIVPTWTGSHTFSPASGNTLITAGNLTVGTSTPSILSGYTTIALSGSVGSFIDFKTGSTNAGRISGQTNSGLVFDSVQNTLIGLYIAGSEKARLDSTGFAIATTTPTGRLTVASANAGDGHSVTAWGNGYSVFGPNAGSSTGAAASIGYDTTNDCANLMSLSPAIAWKPLHIFCGGLNFKASNGVSSGNISTTGNWTLAGSITTAAPSANGAGAWKLGSRITAVGLVLLATNYVEVDIGGTIVKLAEVA